MMNFVNYHDIADGWNMLMSRTTEVFRVFRPSKHRVVGHWDQVKNEGETLSILNERVNTLVSGDAGESRYAYAARRYLGEGNLTAVSVGCGLGEHELEWARQGVFERIDAIDLSPARIAAAKESAVAAGMEDICNFMIGDFSEIARHPGKYDVVIFESSLHHFSPMDEVVKLASDALKPGGLVLLFDFVGPSKWQWLPVQLRLVNALIELLPQQYKRLRNGSMLQKRFRPSLLRMYLMDPSEAVESSKILPSLRALFDELEFKNAGGALLNHFLPKIQHNFDPANSEDLRWLDCLMEFEDLYLSNTDDIGYWDCFGVYQKPPVK